MNNFLKKPICFFLFIVFFSFCSTAEAQWKWGACSTGGAGSFYDAVSMAIDKSGDVYTNGVIESLSGTDTLKIGTENIPLYYGKHEFVITKTDSNGHFLWSVSTTSDQYAAPSVSQMVTDDSDNVYLLGVQSGKMTLGSFTLDSTNSSEYSGTIFIAKISSAGAVLWAQNICEAYSGNEIIIGGSGSFIGIDGAGNLYISTPFANTSLTLGSTTLTNTDVSGLTNDILIAKFNPAGDVIWAKSFGGSSFEATNTGIVTPDGSVYLDIGSNSDSLVVGTTTIHAGFTRFNWIPLTTIYTNLLTKFDSSGNCLWARNLGPNIGLVGLTADKAWNIYADGLIDSNIILGPDTIPLDVSVDLNTMLVLVKFNSAGSPLWADSLVRTSYDYVGNNTISADSCNNIWVCNGFEPNKMIYGHTIPMPGPTAYPIFMAEFNTSGAFDTVLGLPDVGEDYNNGIVDGYGNFYLAVDYTVGSYPLIFGTDTLPAPYHEQLFIAKYRYDSSCITRSGTLPVKNNQSNAVRYSIYPNPTSDVLIIAGAGTIKTLLITNILGQEVYYANGNAVSQSVDVSNLLPGIYIVKINGVMGGKFVKQ